jgi:hypothetical protein
VGSAVFSKSRCDGEAGLLIIAPAAHFLRKWLLWLRYNGLLRRSREPPPFDRMLLQALAGLSVRIREMLCFEMFHPSLFRRRTEDERGWDDDSRDIFHNMFVYLSGLRRYRAPKMKH